MNLIDQWRRTLFSECMILHWLLFSVCRIAFWALKSGAHVRSCICNKSTEAAMQCILHWMICA